MKLWTSDPAIARYRKGDCNLFEHFVDDSDVEIYERSLRELFTRSRERYLRVSKVFAEISGSGHFFMDSCSIFIITVPARRDGIVRDNVFNSLSYVQIAKCRIDRGQANDG